MTNLYDKWNTQDNPAGDCTYGSGQNQMTMTYETFTGWLSYGGAASLVGAPRILQADGKDSIYPGVDFLRKDIMQIMILSEATSLFLLLLWDLLC